MNTPDRKVIIYDDNCPMCALYTAGFVRWGVLPRESRVAFTQLDRVLSPETVADRLDPFRSRHEIPLVDLAGGATLYGVDAMVYLLRQRIPLVGRLARARPLYRFFRFLYSLVSYNRRILVPTRKRAVAFDCSPAFHLNYRLAFIACALVFTSLATCAFGQSVAGYWPVDNPGVKMLLTGATVWAVPTLLALIFMKEKKVDYLGHLATLVMVGALLLLPGIGLSALTAWHYPVIPVFSVLASTATMGWQHFRRMDHLELSQRWTTLWLLALSGTAAGFYTFWV